MTKTKLSSKIIAVALSLLLVFGLSPTSKLTSAYAEDDGQASASSAVEQGQLSHDDSSVADDLADSDASDSASQAQDVESGDAYLSSESNLQLGSASDNGNAESKNSASELDANGAHALAAVAENDATDRDSEVFAGDSYVKSLALSLTSGDVSKSYEVSGGETIDTTADFPDGLARTASYASTIVIDTKSMLEAQGKYPFVKGDTVTCKMPDLIRLSEGTTSGRLRDSTSDWDSANNGVGDYSISKDADGHNVLTIKYDDGYVTEKSGKILSTTVRVSGGFDTSERTTESFSEELIFGNATVKATFSKLEIIRSLSIEKTGTKVEKGYAPGYSSDPTFPRQGSADVDDDGYLSYSVTVKASSDNTYKLSNVKVTDLFDETSKAKVDLSSMMLVSATKEGADITEEAEAITDESGNTIGWNIGNLGAGSEATINFKVKINKDGISNAVKDAMAADAESDAVEARSIKNTATAVADDTSAVTSEYTATVNNYLSVYKYADHYDNTTQTKYFKISITSPSDNRYTMYNVPIRDYLSQCLKESYYKESGISSITVKHADGTSETLTWNSFKQEKTNAWCARISKIQPGDVVTVVSYLTLDDSFWTNTLDSGARVGDRSERNYVYVGNVGVDGYRSNDLNQVYDWLSFSITKDILVKNSPYVKSDGTLNWVISGNEAQKSATPTDVSGLVLNDTLGANQEFTDSSATVTFYNQDGSVAGTDSIKLTAGSTSFTYTIPTEYGTCGYKISYTSKITDWDTYVGPQKTYSNTVNNYTAYSGYRSRVAAMDKLFVEQADDWAKWKTSIYSELQKGDTYTDTSRSGASYMYFTQEDLDAITLTLDGVAIDKSLYDVSFADTSSSQNHSSYVITFKGDVSVTKDGETIKPSKTTPLVIEYKTHMVNPSYSYTRTYYNDATLKCGSVTDTDYDYCRRSNCEEIYKEVSSIANGKITWNLRVNRYGYAAQPDGTCIITETLPAGLEYEGVSIKESNKGKIETVEQADNDDGTTTLKIKMSGVGHAEVCKKNSSDNNYTGYLFNLLLVTKVTDPEYLYGSTSKTFDFVNQASLSDRYGIEKSANATASIEHIAMSKTMTYNQATAPNAQFTIVANEDKADLNPDGDTVGIVDESSKSLSINMNSISVIDKASGDAVDFTVDTSTMADNKFTIYVPDNIAVQITYEAQVVGAVGQDVAVSNSAYYEAYKSESDSNTINQTVTVLQSSGEAESEPMVWLSKKDESATALGGAEYKLESYNSTTGNWTTLRTGITSTSDKTSKGLKVESLDLDTLYRLVETKAPSGYVLDDSPRYFVLMKSGTPTVEYPDDVNASDVIVGPPGTIISAYNQPYTNVRVVKNSFDGAQLAGAQFAVYKVSSDGTVDKTPALDADGNPIEFTSSADAMSEFSIAPGTYQLVETKAPAGYKTADPVTFVVSGNAERAVTVNGQVVQSGKEDAITGSVSVSDETETTSLNVSKDWNDCADFDKVRPGSVKVQLFADYGDGQGSVAATDAEGSEVIAELTSVGADDVSGTSDDWKASFSDLPVAKAGKVIKYSVREIDPATNEAVESGSTLSNGYTVAISETSGDVAGGTDENYSVIVTNSYEPKTTSVSVAKSWDDADDQDGKRPENVTVQLYANGVAVEGDAGKAVLSAENNWSATFSDLAASSSDGNAIVYTVKELDAENYNAPVDFGSETKGGYTPTLVSSNYSGYPEGQVPTEPASSDDVSDGDQTNANQTTDNGDENEESRTISYSIKNAHAPEKIDISVLKTWVDTDSSTRPTSIKVNLLKDGEVFATAVIAPDENGEWKYTFADLDKYQNGEEIEYTVDEVEVPAGYTSSLAGDKETGYTITNTREEAPVAPSPEASPQPEENKSSKVATMSKTGDDTHALLAGLIAGVSAIVVCVSGACLLRARRKNSQ